MENIYEDSTHKKGFFIMTKQPQVEEYRENTIVVKGSEQIIPITSNVAMSVLTINDSSNVRNIANSISVEKLEEYLGKNYPVLSTDDTINNEPFAVSMRPFSDEMTNFYAIFLDYEKTRIYAGKTQLTKNIRELNELEKKW